MSALFVLYAYLNKRDLQQQRKESVIVKSSTKLEAIYNSEKEEVIKVTTAITDDNHCNQLHIKLYPTFFSQS
jgi:hypothetical protein